ncbi:kyphoscoliosis peptidase-like [Pseudophryne corroboree]|uniref:kyphoscoliosis peptidase-like n=1 Tax=Pseudophryne corroboree TaxID=495146 RepID=UPI0030814B04
MWNAVEMAGEWLLLDACWGAGTVDLQKAIFLPSYDDFFFLTAPEEFIETHWPDDPSWQLLERPVSFKDFQQKIFKTSEFFRLSLTVTTPEAFYLTTEDGEVKVSLSYQYPMEFSYKIYKLSNDSRIFVEKTFGILTNQESCMTLRVFPPMDGQYELMVFARPTGTTAPYKWVCSYHIDCPQPKSSLALPENPFHFWGLHQTGKDLGVTSCNPGEDLIVSETSPLNIIFKTSRALMATFQLAHQEMAEPFSKKCLVSQIEETQLRCKVLLPFHGYYRLSLFVKKLEGEHFQNVSNMLINCRNPVNHNELFPLNLSTHCGPGTNTRQHGLTSPSHTSPVISTRTGKCRITFCTLWDLEVFTVLENGRETKSLCPLDRYCLLTQVEQKICLTVHLPEAGQYKLSIFTKPQRAQEFSHACDYVIRCHSNQGLPPFPNVYGAWRRGCLLLQPQAGLLPAESWENFRVKIPGACKVLVIGPVKTELQLTKSTVWEGKVFTGTAGSLIKLAVKFSSNSAEMDIVMSFKTQKTRLDTSSG